MSASFSIDCGPFAKARKDANHFCHNLFLSRTIEECVEHMIKLETEREEAERSGNLRLIKEKELQIQTYQSSLLLTAYILDENDEIST